MAEKNKLNIYYIKKSKELSDVFKDNIETYKKIKLSEGTLYYNPKNVHVPDWVEGFFKQNFVQTYQKEDGTEGEYNIFNTASSQAVFLKKIKYRGIDHLFAITFGSGFQLLKSDAFVPNFGLKCVLNLVSSNNGLRKISKYDISSSPKQTSQQLSKKGSQVDFTLDYQTDILTGITGNFDDKSKKDKILIEYIGKTISGSNSFSVNAKANIKNVDKILKLSVIAYEAQKYKRKGFAWIDNVSYIKHDNILLEKLNNELDRKLADITEESDQIWFAVPEIVRWEDIEGFYFGRQTTVLKDDLNLIEYKQYIKRKEEAVFNIEKLKQSHIYAKNAKGDGYLHCWDAFQCLNAELELDSKTFMLINKNWYEINKNFQDETNKKFESYFNNKSGLNFIDCNYKDEDTYNKELSKQIEAVKNLKSEKYQKAYKAATEISKAVDEGKKYNFGDYSPSQMVLDLTEAYKELEIVLSNTESMYNYYDEQCNLVTNEKTSDALGAMTTQFNCEVFNVSSLNKLTNKVNPTMLNELIVSSLSTALNKHTNSDISVETLQSTAKEYAKVFAVAIKYINKSEALNDEANAIIKETEEKYGEMSKNLGMEVIIDCEDLIGEDLRKKIGSYLNIVKIAVPIILIGFGIIEFTKAIFAGDEDKMKKAQKNFLLRIGIAVIFFLTPTIVDFLLGLANKVWNFIEPGSCGIFNA